MMYTYDVVFQSVLTAAFAVAGLRLLWTAWSGRSNVRMFRLLVAVLSLAWAVWYGHAAWSTATLLALADWARFLQFFNVTVFLLMGFMFKNEQWEELAAKKLKELKTDD